MKKTTVLILALFNFAIYGQTDNERKNSNLSDSITNNKHQKKIYNEIGANATYLLKQLFNSNNGVEVQPYLLTYKLLKNKWALRTGLGVNWSDNHVDGYESNNNYPSPPDQHVPSYVKSIDINGRLGLEYRFIAQRKISPYLGFDLVTQYSKHDSRIETYSNYLPTNYTYQLQKSNTTFNLYGLGPVLGLQFYATKRFSIYTELPMYFTLSKITGDSEQYTDNLTSNGYQISQNNSHYTSTRQNFNISIPATLYLAIKF